MTSQSWLKTANQAVLITLGRELNDVEVAILEGASLKLTYAAIGQKHGYSTSYLERDAGPKLWRILSQALNTRVSKSNFRRALKEYQQSSLTPNSVALPTHLDLTEAPQTPVFWERKQELTLLRQWVAEANNRCQLIAVLGMGGIGKTTFASAWIRQIQGHFDKVIWRNLRDALPFHDLLRELIPFLGNGEAFEPTLRQLLHQLQTTRCLIVLDNLESILQPDQAGQWLSGYEGYGTFLQQVGTLSHTSCVLITSREKPAIIASLEGPHSAVRSLVLEGLTEAAYPLLEAEGIYGKPAQLQQLIQIYGGNPLALKIIASSIRDLFEGDTISFLAQSSTFIFSEVRTLLDSQFERLSDLEKTVMIWLALNREWTTVEQLQDDVIPHTTSALILEALEKLRWRNLVEYQNGRYSQQPVVMEYVSDRFIQQILNEVLSRHLNFFCQYALFKTTVKDYLGASQRRLFIQPIAEYLKRSFTTEVALGQHLMALLEVIRQQRGGPSNYAAGNLLNLSQQLGIDLEDWDCSHLSIWHGNFQINGIRGVNFTGADLRHSAFTDYFGVVLSVCFSPDGVLIANGETQGNIYIRRVEDGEPIHILHGHQSWVRELSFSPDGQRLASCSHDHTIKIWDLHTGECVKTLLGHQEIVTCVTWSPDGRTLASSAFDQTFKLWDVDTGQCLQSFTATAKELVTIEWSPDGTCLIAGDGTGDIQMWEATTGRKIRSFKGHTSQVVFTTQDLQGLHLVTAAQDGAIKVWEIATGQCLQTLSGNFSPSWCAVFHPFTTLLASGCIDGTVRLWDWPSGRCLKVLNGHQALAWRLQFSPDGRYLASGSEDRTLKLWDTHSWQCLRTWQGYVGAIWSIAVNPAGKIAAGLQDGRIRIWDSQTVCCETQLAEQVSLVWAVDWHPLEACLASGGNDGTLSIWNADPYKLIKTIRAHRSIVHCVAWHPAGQQIASCSVDGTVKIHDRTSGECLQTFHQGCYTYAISYHPHNPWLAVSNHDTHIHLWSLSTGTCITSLKGHTAPVWSLAWDATGQYLASASHDGTLRIWQNETCIAVLDSCTAWVWSVAWSPNSQQILGGYQDGTARIWDIQRQECLQVLEGHSSWVRSVAWMQNDQAIATGSADGDIRIWDALSGKCIKGVSRG